MDLKNFTTTSTYAIEAVYSSIWSLIPSKYHIPENDYDIKDMAPFYDAELTFDNRMHYKLSTVEYPKRATPWFVITWNTENGILRSDLTQRTFLSGVLDRGDKKYKCKFINAGLQINLGIVCNTMQGIFELQENLLIKRRNKVFAYTKEHPILGSFPVCLDIVDSQQNKLSRDKGTLCYLMLQCKIDYPVIVDVLEVPHGIIKTINYEINQDAPDDDHLILASGQILAPST